MAVTKVGQTQIKKSGSYDDTLSPGEASLQTASTDNQFDLNALRSQTKRMLGTSEYYADLVTVNGKKRSIGDLNTGLNTIETKKIITFRQLLTDIYVPTTQNYVVLDVSSSESPTQTAGVDAAGLGAVVAVLGDGEIASNRLTVVGGATTLTPKNLVRIVDSSTKDSITSGGQEVFGLIQAQFGTAQGDTFDDSTKKVQISFIINNGSDALAQCPVADIQDKSIEYMYPDRVNFEDLPEDTAFPFIRFAESGSLEDVTFSDVISNQGATAFDVSEDVNMNLTDTKKFKFKSDSGVEDILTISSEVAGDSVDVIGLFTTTGAMISTDAITADLTGQSIVIGNPEGTISSAGDFTVRSTGATSDFTFSAGREIFLDDINRGASTLSSAIKISETSVEFDNYETNFGEVSLINALNQAYSKSVTRSLVVYELDAGVSADGNFHPADHTIISGSNPDWTSDTLADAYIYANGVRLIFGADQDYEAGSTPADGDIELNFAMNIGDTIIVEYG